MLFMALASPEQLNVLGITTVAGNVPLHLTQRNARLICEWAGREDVPVYAGCDRPLARDLLTAEQVHGIEGIDGAPVREPVKPLESAHAVQFICETLERSPEDSLTLVPTGPLTNIGQVLRDRPDLATRIREIVLMGGAMREGGNMSPSAEFNILVDPHAAEIVFGCGRPITVAPLDVSHQVIVTRGVLDALREMTSPVAKACLGMLEFFNRHDVAKYGTEGAPLHDPCTIAWLLRPELFRGKMCNVEIECVSELTMGHTAVDFWGVTGRAPNARWLHEVDAEGFFDFLLEIVARYET